MLRSSRVKSIGKTVKSTQTPNFVDILGPVLWALKVLGICTWRQTNYLAPLRPSCSRRIISWRQLPLWSGLIMVHLTMFVIGYIIRLIFNDDPQETLEVSSKCLTVIGAWFGALIMLISKNKQEKLWPHLSSLSRLPHCHQLWQKMHRKVAMAAGIGWLYLLIRMMSICITVYMIPADKIWRQVPVFGPPPNLSSFTRRSIVCVFRLAETLFVYGPLIFIPLLFVSLGLLLGESYKHHNQSAKQLVSESRFCHVPTAKDLINFRLGHQTISSLVKRVDNLFGTLVLFWLLQLIVGMYLDLTQLLTDKDMWAKHSDDIVHLYLRMLFAVLVFLGTCGTASFVAEEAFGCRSDLYKLSVLVDPSDLVAKFELHLLLGRLAGHRTIGFSAGNFFVMNRNFMLSVIAAVITYCVLVIQLNPIAMATLSQWAESASNTSSSS